MFKPMTEEQTYTYVNSSKMYLLVDNTREGQNMLAKPYTFKLLSTTVTDYIAECDLLMADTSMIVENFNITPQKALCSSELKEMFIRLAVGYLDVFAKNHKKKRIVVYSDNIMVPEILLDFNYKLRSCASNLQGKGSYRGFKSL